MKGQRNLAIGKYNNNNQIMGLRYQVQHKNENSWAYINFLRVGNCIILPGLGAEEDKQACTQIQGLYPECKVLQIEATEVVNKGGALNCITWNIKEQINL